jgi:hypothetical protein
MKGNYYLFEPMVDEKGEQVIDFPTFGHYYDSGNGIAPALFLEDINHKYPILTMKKFDHDPFQKLKDTVEMINEIAKRESTEPGYDFLTDVMKPCSLQMWIAISETVKELEGK